jgi:hypothetical protein
MRVRTAGLAALATAGAIAALSATPAAAQWTDPPPLCSHPSSFGYALSHWHKVPTWANGVGLRVYRIRYSASTEKCGRRSRVVYHLYWDASDLPDSQEIVLSLSSRVGKKWRTACSRQRGGGRACIYFLKGGTEGPRAGSSPWVQYRTTRGRRSISRTLLRHGAIANGAGSAPATWPHSIKLRPK